MQRPHFEKRECQRLQACGLVSVRRTAGAAGFGLGFMHRVCGSVDCLCSEEWQLCAGEQLS